MPLSPLILIALCSAALVVARDARVLLGALVLQWLGLAWMVAAVIPFEAGSGLPVAIEAVTALVCAAILGLTTFSLQDLPPEPVVAGGVQGTSQSARAEGGTQRRVAFDPADRLWPLVLVVAIGVAGLGLARLYPLGGGDEDLLAFYWVVLSAVLVLVLDGARDPVKQAVGLVSLFNGLVLLVNTIGVGLPGVTVPVLLAAARIALAVVLAYGWVVLRVVFRELSFAPLFDLRDEPSTALAVVEEGFPEQAPAEAAPSASEVGEGVTKEPEAEGEPAAKSEPATEVVEESEPPVERPPDGRADTLPEDELAKEGEGHE